MEKRYPGSIFCNYCGVRLPTAKELTVVEPPQDWGPTPPSQAYAPSSTIRPRGRIGLGVVAGFLLLIFLGFIHIFCALIAGIVAGLIARGAGRDAIAGFIAGAVVFSILLSFLRAAVVGVIGHAGLGGLLEELVGGSFVLLGPGSAIICGESHNHSR